MDGFEPLLAELNKHLRRRGEAARFRPVDDPSESYSPWDQGWRLGVAWGASAMIVLLGLANLVIALEVLRWWTTP